MTDLETGRRHVFQLAPTLVELRLDWPTHLVDRLPDDFTLVLSGPQISKQQQTKSTASSDGDLMSFDFQWKDQKKAVQLEASGNGKTVVLWRQQAVGNLEIQIDWNERLHPLLREPEEDEAAEPDAETGAPSDDPASEEPDVKPDEPL